VDLFSHCYQGKEVIFVVPKWYIADGKLDDGIAGTLFPIVSMIELPNSIIGFEMLDYEVNIIPANLDFFIKQTQKNSKPVRANYLNWECGRYDDLLLVVPV
jgi:hypothetical protein